MTLKNFFMETPSFGNGIPPGGGNEEAIKFDIESGGRTLSVYEPAVMKIRPELNFSAHRKDAVRLKTRVRKSQSERPSPTTLRRRKTGLEPSRNSRNGLGHSRARCARRRKKRA